MELGYFSGKLTETGTFEHGDFQELDAGFDFYTPQTTYHRTWNTSPCCLEGLPEIEPPTDSKGWAHYLTLPRE
ncbi:hypothetical protein [Neobacillus sp. DY30]|uniref:hypothetical protein n=1 Tax=Neobacillus sp. DY30 TaxID=3047871 RepID=UPI0024BF5191|nr:hypothetical protein [Neobacillus sp. DY30]WHY03548.1 hypothetical protein QNH29_14580 [Neobacillus sp. DY30]